MLKKKKISFVKTPEKRILIPTLSFSINFIKCTKIK